MGSFNDRIRQLWQYNTIFGNTWFNAIAIFCNVLQIIVTVALLGYFHSKITLEYAWWPSFEVVRLFILTIARVDVILKQNVGIADSAQVRRIIMLCNLIGVFSIVIGGIIYFVLLPNSYGTMYLLFITLLPIFIFVRLCLTAPMFVTLIWGVPFYRLHDGNNYERIADNTLNARQESSEAVDLQHETQMPSINRNSSSVPIYRETFQNEAFYNMMEQRQLEYIMQQSRAENARLLREQQDHEFEEALRQEQQVLNNGEKTSNNTTKTGENNDDNEDESEDEFLEENNALAQKILSLRELPEEPERSVNTVSTRVRLPNGVQIVRLFDRTATIGDVKLWINHQLIDNDLSMLVNNFQLVSTMPRTIYKDDAITFEKAGFWVPNAKRECRTPLLYVEESTPKDNDINNYNTTKNLNNEIINRKEIGERATSQKA